MNRSIILLTGLLSAALPLLIDSALKGVALLTLAGLLSLALGKASAAVRHFVWLIALGALLALPMLSAMLPGWRVLPSWILIEPQVAASPAVPSAPLTEEVSPLNPEPMVRSPGVAGTVGPQSASAESPLTFRDWLPLAWAAGFTLLMARLLAARFQLSQAARRCEVISAGRLHEMMESARQKLQISQSVQLLLDTNRSIPMVWGLIRPKVMLPAEAIEWSEHQIRSVLLHELAHIKRRDLAAQFLIQLTCALHWFNPFVWFAAWRLHVEAERACDNLVLTNGVRASDYAEHVLHVATRLVPSCGNGAGLAMARSTRLEGRMLAVLSSGLNRRGVTRALITITLVFGLCVIIPMAMLRAADEKKPAPPDPLKPATADSQTAEQKRATGNRLANAEPDDETVVTVDVAVDGSISLNGKAVTVNSLSNELASLPGGNPKVHVDVHVATGARFDRVVEVFDELEKSGAGAVTLRTPGKSGVSRIPGPRGADRANTIRQKRLLAEAERDANRETNLFRNEVEAAQANVAVLKLRQAENQLKRLEKLHAENLIGAQELDQARLEVERTKAESAVDSKEKMQAELDLAKAEVALSEANLKRMSDLADKNLVAESELEMAQAQTAIAKAKLRATTARLNTSDAWKQHGEAWKQSVRTWPTPAANPGKKERLLEILADEIKVAEEQAKIVREQRNQGLATAEALFRAELDVMSLQRERASMQGDPVKVKELIARQISILQELEKTTRQQQQQGVSSESEALKVRRQILMLQRQQAQMDF